MDRKGKKYHYCVSINFFQVKVQAHIYYQNFRVISITKINMKTTTKNTEVEKPVTKEPREFLKI